MLITREEDDLEFFTGVLKHRAGVVADDIYSDSSDNSGWYIDGSVKEWSVPFELEIMDNMIHYYVDEIIHRQANLGDLNTHFNQNEAILALNNSDAYDNLYDGLLDFLSYNGGFNGNMLCGLEEEFVNDIFTILNKDGCFYLSFTNQDDSSAYHEGYESYVPINSPLQEVW